MVQTIVFKDLLDILIRMNGAFVFYNAHGAMELRGADFYMSPSTHWLTVYHTDASSPESRSHVHLKWRTLESASIVEEEGQTPHLAFFTTTQPVDEPQFVWYFPDFYDWGNNKAEIPSNIAQYENFVQQYGNRLQFVDPDIGEKR
ncbi:MAG: hypothetical protein ETSY1_02270 [Candidatus Entotheonella factor]|uniref:Uncharacterized protein n=1 Tax=Entotheonella factor TaxID=1429438 RepID=W4LZJ5_ENTF1|nr:hypothetical protein [Candidatus Entotheonella palauensis]ETX02792.1 MAG: hypothetical protein ETSY1_02270 [Candidatus Entotheonella factor]